ncbi:MAG: type II secretion pathway protein GspD, partial [Pseudomonadota bacterium]
MRIWKQMMAILLIAAIAGCAINNKTFSTRNLDFIDGQKLIADGEFENGMQKLEKAAREEPENTEIRTVLIRQRDEIIGKLLFDADNTRFSGDLNGAEQKYQRVLNLFPFHERAREGLEAVESERRHIASVETAKELLARNDVTGAETIIRAVLQENPTQSHARQLISQINSRIARA